MLNKQCAVTENSQFDLLCAYGDIITSKSIIVENETRDQFLLFKIVEPFPTFEEFLLGEEFEEGDLITTFGSLEQAKEAQNYLKITSP